MDSGGPLDGSPEAQTHEDADSRIDWRIGAYRVLRELGHGGMGVVYLAARADDQYRKRVAIKVIPAGATSQETVRHFRRERQILASLEHPNIARLLDGGTTTDGAPYIVMEFVEGESIDRFCERHDLSLAERLRMFLVVCGAVSHAHRNLVVHRDLKPRNILVTQDGEPKLLDFGIATVLNSELSGDSVGTRLAFTPEYASPEQIQNQSVSTAADIYSLGVVLYELLTRRSPYRLKTRTPSEIFQAVCEQQPDLPSAAAGRTEAVATADAQTTGAPDKAPARRASVQRRLKGDLDTILLKALRKEPHQRYLSVEAFAEDLRRFLDGRPVAACRPTVAYRTGKFLRRHWLPTTAAAALALTLMIGSAALAVQARRLAQERDKSERIAGFLTELFNVADPSRSRGNSVTAREILDEGVKKIDATLASDPLTRGDLLGTMGHVYEGLGLYAEAERLGRQALTLHRATLGEAHETTQRETQALAFVLAQLGRPDEAIALLEPLLPVQRRSLGEDHALTLTSKHRLGVLYVRSKRLDDGERLLTQAVAARTRLLGRDDEATLESLNNLAILHHAQGRVDEALALDREVLGHRRRRLGADHPRTMGSLNNVAYRLGTLGRYDEARPLLEEALAVGERLWGVGHPNYGTLLHSLGEVELGAGNLDTATQRLEAALAIYRQQPGHRLLGLVLYQLAQIDARQGLSSRALDRLGDAVRAGAFRTGTDELAANPHLAPLAGDPRFRALLAEARASRP